MIVEKVTSAYGLLEHSPIMIHIFKAVTNSNIFGALTSIDIVEDYEEEVKDDINSVFFNL